MSFWAAEPYLFPSCLFYSGSMSARNDSSWQFPPTTCILWCKIWHNTLHIWQHVLSRFHQNRMLLYFFYWDKNPKDAIWDVLAFINQTFSSPTETADSVFSICIIHGSSAAIIQIHHSSVYTSFSHYKWQQQQKYLWKSKAVHTAENLLTDRNKEIYG